MTEAARITDPAEALNFIFAGRARFTLVSTKTGTRYTYRVSIKEDEGQAPIWFAGVLSGPSNETDYTYIGFVKGGRHLIAGRKGRPDAPSYKALDWTLRQLDQGHMPEALEFWHEGRCCRCGRVLTDPVSIARGIGPECLTKVAA